MNERDNEYDSFLDSLDDGGVDNSETEIEIFRQDLLIGNRALLERLYNQQISRILESTVLNTPFLYPENN